MIRKVINFRKAKKQVSRAKREARKAKMQKIKERQAPASRLKSNRTKAQKRLEKTIAKKAKRHIDAHKRENK